MNKEIEEENEKVSKFRYWGIVFGWITAPIIGGLIFLAFKFIKNLIEGNEHSFFEPLNYGINWLYLLGIGCIWGLGFSLWIFFLWSKKKIKEGSSDKKDISKGDAKWMKNYEAVLNYSPMFEDELSTQKVDGLIVGHRWIKNEAVKDIKKLLLVLRGITNEGVMKSHKTILKTLERLEMEFYGKIKAKNLQGRVLEIRKDLKNSKYSSADAKLTKLISELGASDVWREKYKLFQSPEVLANVASAGIEKEYKKGMESYENGLLNEFKNFVKKYSQEMLTEDSISNLKGPRYSALKSHKNFAKKNKEEFKLIKEFIAEKDFIGLEEMIVKLEAKYIASDVKGKKKKDKKASVKSANKIAKDIAKLISLNTVKVELTADGRSAKRPTNTKTSLLYFVSNNGLHSAIVGSTGAAKTVAIINPTIDIFAQSANKPTMVISDVKGELFAKRSQFLRDQGYEVHALNFKNKKNSSKWNPLSVAVDFWKEAIKLEMKGEYGDASDQENAVDGIVNELAKSIFPAKGRDPFWENSAGNMLKGLIWFVFEVYKDSYIEWTNSSEKEEERIWPESGINEKQINLAYILRLSKQLQIATGLPKRTIFKAYYAKFPEREKDKSFQFLIGILNSPDSPTTGSIIKTFEEKMLAFESGIVMGITSETNIPLGDLGNKPVAVFMIIPDEKANFNFFGTLFVSQVYLKLVDTANKNPTGANPKKVHFLLDEFGNFPAIANMETIITVARGRGIRFHLVLQDYAQLESVYGQQTARTIKGNLDLTIYLLTSDTGTAQDLSKRIGNQTIVQDNESRSTSSGKTSVNRSTTSFSQPLISPETLLRQKFLTGVVLSARKFPLKTKFIPYFFDENVEIRETLGSATLSDTSLTMNQWNKKHSWDQKIYRNNYLKTYQEEQIEESNKKQQNVIKNMSKPKENKPKKSTFFEAFGDENEEREDGSWVVGNKEFKGMDK